MGKPKSGRRRGEGRTSGKPSKSAYSIEDILAKAEQCMDEYKYELAQKFCQRALEIESDNVRALELTAGLLLEMGQTESAQQCLGRAIFVQPDSGHTKYLTLAQILSGTESRDLYRKGIEVINSKISSLDPADESLGDLRRDLSNAYVSISEIYMTDLCDEAEAQAESKRCIDLAVQTDQSNPESFQALANYSLVTGNTDDARTAIDKSISLWLEDHLKFLEKGEGKETSLSYTFRLSTAKILLDLEDYDVATKVLESLLEEDEEVVSTWYLLGWMNYLRSSSDPDYSGNARFYLVKAREINTVAPTDDDAMVEHIQELLSELGDAKEEAGEEGELNIVEAEPEAVAELLDKEADQQLSSEAEAMIED